jgi:hypothetical protein
MGQPLNREPLNLQTSVFGGMMHPFLTHTLAPGKMPDGSRRDAGAPVQADLSVES